MNKLSYTSIIFLLLALLPMPYGYYTLLRLFLFITSCFYMFNDSEEEKSNLFYGWLILMLLYNPIIPVYLSRDIWQAVNILSILFISFGIYRQK